MGEWKLGFAIDCVATLWRGLACRGIQYPSGIGSRFYACCVKCVFSRRIYDKKKWDRHNHSEYGKDGLLRVYNNYTEYFQAVRKGAEYDFQISGLKECKIKLREIIKNIDNELKSLGL